jgi:Arc/MetJ family transcription regulator
MRTTINLDDALLDRARELSGLKERSTLLREALEALIQRESARRLKMQRTVLDAGVVELSTSSHSRRRCLDRRESPIWCTAITSTWASAAQSSASANSTSASAA